MNSVVVATAPTGAYKSVSDHKHLPITPAEIADEAYRCQQLGVSMLHLHVRDTLGKHSIHWEHYEPAIDAVRERCGNELIIQCTTESARRYNWAEQFDAITKMKHDFVSIAIREAAGDQGEPSLTKLTAVFDVLFSNNVTCQIILYDPSDFRLLKLVVDKFPDGQFTLLFVLGKYRKGHQSEPEDLRPFLDENPYQMSWMVCAFGNGESDCLLEAAKSHGHIRVGFENNLIDSRGLPFTNNSASVAFAIEKLKSNDIQPMSVDHARKVLKLQNR